MNSSSEPTRSQINRWRQYLANERAEAAVYWELARRATGEERAILMTLAEAESRHETYWRKKLGEHVGMPKQPDWSTRINGFLARRFGTVFVLALMQNAEQRSPYLDDEDASEQIAADERIHAEIIRGLAARGRESMSGSFRAAIFGANDGLVSNLALVVGIMGSGVSGNIILLTGISGLLSGALSMAAGEYISVKSQSELLEASTPNPGARQALPQLDVNANELALVYRARGMSEDAAERKARSVLAALQAEAHPMVLETPISEDEDAVVGPLEVEEVVAEAAVDNGEAWKAALSSFLCFGSGALIPVLPFLFPISSLSAGIVSVVLVSLALMITGGITGVLSGRSPWTRALRQLAIGLGAATVTYVLGTLFGVAIG